MNEHGQIGFQACEAHDLRCVRADSLKLIEDLLTQIHFPESRADLLLASRLVDNKVVRTKPLCPSPQVARFPRHGRRERRQRVPLRRALSGARRAQRQQLVTREQVTRLEQAQRNGRAAEVPQIVRELLTRPDLPAQLRSALERMPDTAR